MKAATINELKQELQNIPPAKVTELCLRLARFKKENKELLTYLLFEADDIPSYIANVKNEMDTQFYTINKSNVYFVKKTLRKILRITNKYIKYTGSKQAEVALLIYFCQKMKNAGIRIQKLPVLHNLYLQQIKKINAALTPLHEDLQYDYQRDLDGLALEEKEDGSLVAKFFGKRPSS